MTRGGFGCVERDLLDLGSACGRVFNRVDLHCEVRKFEVHRVSIADRNDVVLMILQISPE